MNVEKSVFYFSAYIEQFKIIFLYPKSDFCLGVPGQAYICKYFLKLKKNINLHSYPSGRMIYMCVNMCVCWCVYQLLFFNIVFK